MPSQTRKLVKQTVVTEQFLETLEQLHVSEKVVEAAKRALERPSTDEETKLPPRSHPGRVRRST